MLVRRRPRTIKPAGEGGRIVMEMFDSAYRDSRLGEPPFEASSVSDSKLAVRLLESALRPGSELLSLGSGRGLDEERLARQGISVTAVDFSAEAVSQLQARVEREGIPNLTVVHADVLRYRIRGNYDGIVGIGIMHVIDPGRIPGLLRKIALHTRPGGFNLYEYPNGKGMSMGSFEPGVIPEDPTFGDIARALYVANGWSFSLTQESFGKGGNRIVFDTVVAMNAQGGKTEDKFGIAETLASGV
ncbi:MAG: class I SAM-dependent methyltransferase [Candidatus Micrarchaeota archaeon]|nr:class I SAM-dependent methyltransferase [Candidatus Micrarchaeota archaeon]